MAVRTYPLPGYEGRITVNDIVYGVKTLRPSESIERLETNNTETPVATLNSEVTDGGTVTIKKYFATAIQSTAALRLSVAADYGADSDAAATDDPPNFETIGPKFCIIVCGDTYVGTFLIDELSDSLEAKGIISYEWSMTSDGPYYKNPIQSEITTLNAWILLKYGVSNAFTVGDFPVS